MGNWSPVIKWKYFTFVDNSLILVSRPTHHFRAPYRARATVPHYRHTVHTPLYYSSHRLLHAARKPLNSRSHCLQCTSNDNNLLLHTPQGNIHGNNIQYKLTTIYFAVINKIISTNHHQGVRRLPFYMWRMSRFCVLVFGVLTRLRISRHRLEAMGMDTLLST